jgi:hypothetical protein
MAANMFPAMTTTELTCYSLIFLAATVTRSEGDTDGTLQRTSDGNIQSQQQFRSYIFLAVATSPAIFSYDS